MTEINNLKKINSAGQPGPFGLYDPKYEHDGCGVGFVVNINGTKSHEIIERGIEVMINLLHRGATGGDTKTGDGAGILIQIPDAFLKHDCNSIGISLPAAGKYGIGMIFLPQEQNPRNKCRQIIEETVVEEGLEFLGWREVPVNDTCLGDAARNSQPVIFQCFIEASQQDILALERKLYTEIGRASCRERV